MPGLIFLALLAVVLAGVYFRKSSSTNAPAGRPEKSRESGTADNSDEAKLLRCCFNDAEQMERLIAFEQKRTPSETRAQAVRSALAAISRGNR